MTLIQFVSLETPACQGAGLPNIVNTEEVMVAMRGRVLCADEETVSFLVQVSMGGSGIKRDYLLVSWVERCPPCAGSMPWSPRER